MTLPQPKHHAQPISTTSPPTTPLFKSPTTKQADPCTICLASISHRAIATPCNHWTFDFLCLATWAQTRAVCPLCNTRLEGILYDFEGPGVWRTLWVGGGDGGYGKKGGWRAQPRSRNEGASNPASGTGFQRLSQNHQGANRQRNRRYPRSHPLCLSNHKSPPTSDPAIAKRRHIYNSNLYAAHIGCNRQNRYQDFSPSSFRSSPSLQSRARAWLRRELSVFSAYSPAHPPTPSSSSSSSSVDAYAQRTAANTSFTLDYILAILSTHDLKRLGEHEKAVELLTPFLNGKEETARLFLHETNAFLRSPYQRAEEWDCVVQYPRENECERKRERLGKRTREGG